MGSEERFGYEWNRYSKILPEHRIQFLNWINPVLPDDFKNKKVLDAGCGMGRNAYWALQFQAREVVGFDNDLRSVHAAERNLKKFQNARIYFNSIYELEWENEFDIVMSIGVIHHLERPKAAVKRLISAARPGGTVLLWVYSSEGNEWIVKWVDPIRKKITSRLPLNLVHALTYCASIPIWLYLRLIDCSNLYLKQLKGFRFYHVHSIVFDQLIPKTANYWTKDQARNILNDIRIDRIGIQKPGNNMGWTVWGVKHS